MENNIMQVPQEEIDKWTRANEPCRIRPKIIATSEPEYPCRPRVKVDDDVKEWETHRPPVKPRWYDKSIRQLVCFWR